MNTLNIILDARRSERVEPLFAELKRQKITDYEIWPCIILPDVVSSINASHKMIVQKAKDLNWEYVFIGEDDLWLPAEDGWKYFLSKMPKSFDVYSSATYVNDKDNRNKLCGFHLYAVARKFYDRFLSIPDNKHIDTACDEMGGDFHVCRPFAALQRAGFSSNNRAICDYNVMLNKEDIYYGKQENIPSDTLHI